MVFFNSVQIRIYFPDFGVQITHNANVYDCVGTQKIKSKIFKKLNHRFGEGKNKTQILTFFGALDSHIHTVFGRFIDSHRGRYLTFTTDLVHLM